MRRPETLDIDERKLPSSGRIALTDVMAEFQRGTNNMLDYAGAVAGVPSIPPLKLSDFYGKENVSGAAPYGNYDGYPVLEESWRDPNPSLGTWFMDSITGEGKGSPVSFPDFAGVVGANIYGDKDEVAGWAFFVGSVTSDDVERFNRYSGLSIQVSGFVSKYYSGSWEYRLFDGWPHAAFINPSAGDEIRYALDTNRSFFVSLQS